MINIISDSRSQLEILCPPQLECNKLLPFKIGPSFFYSAPTYIVSASNYAIQISINAKNELVDLDKTIHEEFSPRVENVNGDGIQTYL